MKTQLMTSVPAPDQTVDAPTVLPLELLKQVAGGLPYHGFQNSTDGQSMTADTETGLPYHGF